MRYPRLYERTCMKTGVFYFVRHGESEWNIANKICGATDIPLTAHGIAQAHALGEKIREEGLHIDKVLCSPLRRAKRTAEEICAVTGFPLFEEERLREQNFGRYEGTPRNGEEFRIAKTRFIDSYGGGETMFETAHRVYSLLDEITSQTDTVYLLAAHNGITRFVESYFRNMSNEEFASFGIGNCEIRTYTYTVR